MKVSNAAVGQTLFQAENLNDKPAALNDGSAPVQSLNHNQDVFAKKSDGDSIAAFNRQRFFAAQENKAVQNTNPENPEINGITENTKFRIVVGEPEAPELKRPESRQNDLSLLNNNSVPGFPKPFKLPVTQGEALQAAFEAMADKAGLTHDAKQTFVNERLRANTVGGNLLDQTKPIDLGTIKINNRDNNNLKFGNDEWEKLQGGTIDIVPTADDIEALKENKANGEAHAGGQAAVNLLRAVKSGDRSLIDKALGDAKAQQSNENFQRGFVEELGADNFVKLEKTLAGNQSDGANVLRESLATASKSNLFPIEVQREIAQKADMNALTRLTGSESSVMSKDFLIEAGKRATAPGVGWKSAVIVSFSGEAIRQEGATQGSNQILAAVSRSPEAAAELLQNEDFVKNALRMGNMNDTDAGTGFAQILRAGTSAEARQSGSENVERAIMTVSQTLRNREYLSPDTTVNQNQELLGLNGNKVNSTVANAMADVYLNNTDVFSKAASLSGARNDTIDGEDVREFIGAIQPHYSVQDQKTGITIQDKMAATTAVRYMNLLNKAEETGDASHVTEAANLVGAFVNGNARANVENAKEKDARQEKLSKAVAIATEVIPFYSLKEIGEMGADVVGKVAGAIGENSVKGNNADNAVEENRTALNEQQTTNILAVVQTFEQAAFDRTNGRRATTPEQKQKGAEFLADLKTYNDTLPANEKILDQSGRLINPAKMNGGQQHRLTNIFGEGTGKDYRMRLSNRMQATFAELRDATKAQIN